MVGGRGCLFLLRDRPHHGYGDIVPRRTPTRALPVVIGFGGILLTGLVAAIAVNAMRATLTDGGKG